MTCATCKWCHRGEDAAPECRRWPPMGAAVFWRGRHEPRTVWPGVLPDDWCGEYASLTPTEQQIAALAAAVDELPAPAKRSWWQRLGRLG
jgi:hypothetical protein